MFVKKKCIQPSFGYIKKQKTPFFHSYFVLSSQGNSTITIINSGLKQNKW